MSVHWGIEGLLGAEVKPSVKAWAPQVLHCALLADCCVAAAGHAGEALPALAPLWARQARAAQVGALTWAPPLRGSSGGWW